MRDVILVQFTLNTPPEYSSFWFARTEPILYVVFEKQPTKKMLIEYFENAPRYSPAYGNWMDALKDLCSHWNEENEEVKVAGVPIGRINRQYIHAA